MRAETEGDCSTGQSGKLGGQKLVTTKLLSWKAVWLKKQMTYKWINQKAVKFLGWMVRSYYMATLLEGCMTRRLMARTLECQVGKLKGRVAGRPRKCRDVWID